MRGCRTAGGGSIRERRADADAAHGGRAPVAGMDHLDGLRASPGVQVGAVSTSPSNLTRVAAWVGSTGSFIDLYSPSGYFRTIAVAYRGGDAGRLRNHPIPRVPFAHTLLRRGSAESVIDPHPPGDDASSVRGVRGRWAVGHSAEPATHCDGHAAVRSATDSPPTDLHLFLPAGAIDSRAFAVAADETIVGEAGFGSAVPRAGALLRLLRQFRHSCRCSTWLTSPASFVALRAGAREGEAAAPGSDSRHDAAGACGQRSASR